ncbi:MAG: aminotransferase class III-fold pyridoxal phosphate-dependent enzyme, partial [Candidatus Aminicenantes bacterium]|nr:aminotransferase class III-fold pyridoxal phosphate-dependent enzyme [Candidatus Aminicenantes bacterium]
MSRREQSPWADEKVEDLVKTHFGVTGSAAFLHGEHDHNYRIHTPGRDYLLKISPPGSEPEILDLCISALDHLAETDPELPVPRVQYSLEGKRLVEIESPDMGVVHLHLLSWLPGILMADTRPRTPRLAYRLGAFLARVDKSLAGFYHDAQNRELVWDLCRAPELSVHVHTLKDPQLQQAVSRILAEAGEKTIPALAGCPRQVVHNDANDHNVLLGNADPWVPEISGLVDFGDLINTYRVCEPAIAAAYACLYQQDPVAAIAAVAQGYHQVFPLQKKEIDRIFCLVRLRLAASLVVAARRLEEEPENAYHQISRQAVRETFLQLTGTNPLAARARIRKACGLAATAGAMEFHSWLAKNRGSFAPVMQGLNGPVRVLDLSVSGRHAQPSTLNADAGWQLPPGEGMAVGRYNEARLCYTTPQFCSPAGPRTIHLGMDLFATAGTAVCAPLDGIVVSAVDNAFPGDYGPTVILRHTPADGPPFFTLYGHLARESITDLKPGTPVGRGREFVRLGADSENGGWPPHLHFQVMADLLDCKDNFPGVAAPGEKEAWLEICPDPNNILNIPAEAFPAPPMNTEEILVARRHRLNPALSISYRRPLTMVRGFMQFMYDRDGHRFLDAVNNVPHVGHCHPRVVDAVATQAAILNTNTRYLHPLLAEYAQRLTDTLPDPLQVCFFCNSGSEANDLALRLARSATGRRDMVVLDAAYHGNLAGLINISPYKFNGKGGTGRPPHTHVFPLPDPLRGEYRGLPDSGEHYARKLREMLRILENAGTPAAAFMAESLPGCGGQIVLPAGFLARAFATVRAAGGVAIADEVQVGFGRVGDAFWGFQTQDALPDIVTMGKPMGNGHPLAAVVTTREVADAFHTGMEYFNTYGGNPVSCAAGLAVLDVIRDEGLQDHARRVGNRLKADLETLKSRHHLVADVRGLGLFIGIEIVRSRENLEAAEREAAYISERMRDLGILISVDGPLHNVLKIKPPMCFSETDAVRLVETLD